MENGLPFIFAAAAGAVQGGADTAPLTPKEFIVRLAEGLNALVSSALSGFFGQGADPVVYGRITLSQLVSAGLIILAAFLLHAIAAWLLSRKKHAPGERDPKAWRPLIIQAVGKPLYLLLWIAGIYIAVVPLLIHLTPEGEPHPILRFLDRLFDIGLFILLIWLFVRLTGAAGERVKTFTGRSKGVMDDILAQLLIKSLRVAVPVIAIILALPLLNLPSEYEFILTTASGILIIATIAWILTQGVLLMEKVVLAKYDISVKDNLRAREIYTQVHVLKKTLLFVIGLFTAASVLMLFEEVRRLGTSILASAGVVGIIIGFAAQRTIANIFAGLQIALSQPIRLDDVVIVENEWGRIEEITLTYVAVRIWDARRLVVPINYFIEKPFQNWTRVSAEILGTIFWHCDYTVPLDEMRQEVERLIKASPKWDGRVALLQVVDTTERTVTLRALASAATSGDAWDLRCEVREQIIVWLQKNHPSALPKIRAEIENPAAIMRPQQNPANQPAAT